MRTLYFAIGLSLGGLLLTAITAKETNSFEGKWVLDKNGSTPQSDIPEGLIQQIKQKGNKVMIESVWREPKDGIAPLLMLGLMITKLELTADGSEKFNKIGPFEQTSKTTVDGKQMVTEWAARVNGDTVTGHWTRTLSDDGHSQTLEVKETSKGQTKEAKLVFHKK